LAQMSRGMSK